MRVLTRDFYAHIAMLTKIYALLSVFLSVCCLASDKPNNWSIWQPFNIVGDGHRRLTVNGVEASEVIKLGVGKVMFYEFGAIHYFAKNARVPPDAVVASEILNFIYNQTQRFPKIYLGYNPSRETWYTFSEKLKGYRTIHDLYKNNNANNPFAMNKPSILADLASVYVALYLVGGGDVHPGNIVYSVEHQIFGDVDLDDYFRYHIASKDLKNKDTNHPLALREFNCSDPCQNFLYSTDSKFHKKNEGTNYGPAYNYMKLHDKKLYTSQQLLDAMEYLVRIPLLKIVSLMENIKEAMYEGYQNATNKSLEPLWNETYKIEFVKDRYHFLETMVDHYTAYKAKRSGANVSMDDLDDSLKNGA
jgi:hypothetical protein